MNRQVEWNRQVKWNRNGGQVSDKPRLESVRREVEADEAHLVVLGVAAVRLAAVPATRAQRRTLARVVVDRPHRPTTALRTSATPACHKAPRERPEPGL